MREPTDQGTACPVYRSVLCATDLSPTGDCAVHLAYRIVAPRGIVSLVHVYDPSRAAAEIALPDGAPAPTFDAIKDAAERAALAHLHRLGCASDRPDVTTNEFMLHHPNPVAAIEERAAHVGADALVLGTHGRSGLGRLLMGSVATEVLRRSKRAVILLHDPNVRDA
jgi:nucleotide-binding universal stress UspA family protein